MLRLIRLNSPLLISRICAVACSALDLAAPFVEVAREAIAALMVPSVFLGLGHSATICGRCPLPFEPGTVGIKSHAFHDDRVQQPFAVSREWRWSVLRLPLAGCEIVEVARRQMVVLGNPGVADHFARNRAEGLFCGRHNGCRFGREIHGTAISASGGGSVPMFTGSV